MKKKTYINPDMEITEFEMTDVIVTSPDEMEIVPEPDTPTPNS